MILHFLKDFSLGTGIGIHCGFLVEGLLGSQKIKAYDVIGGTAKRICDHANETFFLVQVPLGNLFLNFLNLMPVMQRMGTRKNIHP